MSQQNTRNFCIIAHIDHGKSTLADRFLELTKTVETRKMKDQLLDQMDLERERGITIKLQPARMEYKSGDQKYILNLIDTPGHVDFSYEVSRSLAAVEGAILLVDATQGIQAQTLANLYLAMEQDLEIIPVINKIDMPNAMIKKVSKEISDLIGVEEDEIIKISAKTGENVKKVLEEVIKKVPAPIGKKDEPLRALIFDSYFDSYKGVVAQVRIIDGKIENGDQIYFLGTKLKSEIIELGVIKPQLEKTTLLEAGDVGYIATGLKEVGKCRVGDTITKYESSFKDAKEIEEKVKPL
ncbi:MAG: GTP-binding protein, partial [Candidatus Andersenbacteria bacterium]|nr:GTP-binding protein [Candidatus Andersenbacteria bacterium]